MAIRAAINAVVPATIVLIVIEFVLSLDGGRRLGVVIKTHNLLKKDSSRFESAPGVKSFDKILLRATPDIRELAESIANHYRF
jgi:hypothetical protein